MKSMLSIFASIVFFVTVFAFTSCKSQCDCANCVTTECCNKCTTVQVETPADSTGTVTDTIPLKSL